MDASGTIATFRLDVDNEPPEDTPRRQRQP
jgi:hypothetical protein